MIVMTRRVMTTSKNSEALRRAKAAMAEELARTEAKERAFTDAFDAIVRRQKLDAQLGTALCALIELNVPRKTLVTELHLSTKEIQRLTSEHQKEMAETLNESSLQEEPSKTKSDTSSMKK